MLTADLVHTRRRGDRLVIVPLTEAERPRAHDLAASILDLVRAHVGLPRGALLDAWGAVPVAPSESLLARGLFKLALDACHFEEGSALDPVAIRRDIFLDAARARRDGGHFNRAAVLAQASRAYAVDIPAIEDALYADLPTAHVLRRAELPSPDGLLAAHELGSYQAVLLRAVHVRARVWNASPHGYRALFRALKFHRLLFTIAELERGRGYAIDLDGPMSLFDQTTKYGLNLALVLPAIMASDRWDVDAELRWGKDRRPLRYHVQGRAGSAGEAPPLPDDVATILAELERAAASWKVAAADAIFNVPGLGVCVPDLEFVHAGSGRRAYLEVLGFWSRAAVWKRVEMAEAGLPFPIVFAINKRLRVSEEVIPDPSSAALYVYARTMNAKAVLERIETVARVPAGPPRRGP